MSDYHDHLETALVWWEMDEEVLEAIAHSRAGNRSHRHLAGYVLQLKRTVPTAPGRAHELEAITKIAERLSKEPVPEVVRFPRRRSPILRVVAVAAAAVALALAVLMIGYATHVIEAPEPVRDLLRKIGVDPEPRAERDGSVPVPDEIIEAAPVDAPQQAGNATEGSDDAAPSHRNRPEVPPAQKPGAGGQQSPKEPPATSQRDFGRARRPEKGLKPPRPTPPNRPTPRGRKPDR
jgi:hypothetical protein